MIQNNLIHNELVLQTSLSYLLGYNYYFLFADGNILNCTKCLLQSEFLVVQQSTGSYRVGDVMTKREELHVVKPTTSVDDGALFLICCTCLPYFRSVERDHSILLFFAALEMLVKHRISGFPVIDDDWNLVGTIISSSKPMKSQIRNECIRTILFLCYLPIFHTYLRPIFHTYLRWELT